MLSLIWINHRWPYAATEEWAKPWLGVLVSHNICLLFCIPHILIRPSYACTPICNFPWLIIIMHNNFHTWTINVKLPFPDVCCQYQPLMAFFCLHTVDTQDRATFIEGNNKPSKVAPLQWCVQYRSFAHTDTLWSNRKSLILALQVNSNIVNKIKWKYAGWWKTWIIQKWFPRLKQTQYCQSILDLDLELCNFKKLNRYCVRNLCVKYKGTEVQRPQI